MVKGLEGFERALGRALERVKPEAIKKAHITAAQRGIADLEAKQGRLPRTTVVDGRPGVSEGQVKAGGVIRYEISPVAEIVSEIHAELVRRSPVRTGNYVRHIFMFVNGIPFDEDKAGRRIEVYPPGTEIVFINTAPYARKIEGGKRFVGSFGRTDPDRQLGLSAQAPDGVFEITARAMARRFGNHPVAISFEYRVAIDGAFSIKKAARVHGTKGRFVGQGGGATRYRFPCVVIKVPS